MRNSIIFDVDGTLCDSIQVLHDSWESACKGIPHTELSKEFIQTHMGKNMDIWAKDVFPSVSFEKASAFVKACEEAENKWILEKGTCMMPDTEESCKLLSKDYDLYVLSNCGLGYIEAVLAHSGLQPLIQGHVCFGDTGLEKAENIRYLMKQHQIQQAIYIGDTKQDYLSTMKAGIPFLFASYGFGEIEESVPSVASMKEIPEKVKELFECYPKDAYRP